MANIDTDPPPPNTQTVLVIYNVVLYGHKIFKYSIKRQKVLVLSLKNLLTLL